MPILHKPPAATRRPPTKVHFEGLAKLRADAVASERLRRHCYVDTFRMETCSSGTEKSLPELIDTLGPSSSPFMLKSLRRALCAQLDERAAVVMPKVPELVAFLQSSSPESQFEAAWILTNLLHYGAADALIQHGGVACFVDLLSSKNDAVRSQAVWALGNLAGVSESHRDQILQCDVLSRLHPDTVGVRDITLSWSLCNLVRGRNPPPEWHHVEKAIPIITTLLDDADPEVLSHAVWAFCYVIEAHSKALTHSDSSLLSRVLRFARFENPAQLPSIRVLMRCACLPSWGEYFTDALATCRTAPKTFMLTRLQEECAGHCGAIEPLLPFVPNITQCLKYGVASTTLTEQWVCTMHSMLRASPKAIEVFVRSQGCERLVEILDRPHGCPALKLKALEAARILLDEGYTEAFELTGGLLSLDALQEDVNDQVYSKALELLDKFFPDEDDW
eukprot:GEMP01035374.1.p1 GENE.GEMP01035374.1~~GEMP01035374.1.p1  ORF type:complete len:448 (+),score=89.65 GEMP01035374.1:232-1575(+)